MKRLLVFHCYYFYVFVIVFVIICMVCTIDIFESIARKIEEF